MVTFCIRSPASARRARCPSNPSATRGSKREQFTLPLSAPDLLIVRVGGSAAVGPLHRQPELRGLARPPVFDGQLFHALPGQLFIGIEQLDAVDAAVGPEVYVQF